MLTANPDRARRAGTIAVPVPWTDVYGLARTLVAVGAALTLIFSSPSSLFSYRVDIGLTPVCDGARGALAFCLLPREQLWIVHAVCVLVLIIAASGWRPRVTCIPQWYVHFSLVLSMSSPDGGDQLAAIIALLLIPVALTDARRWHWAPAVFPGTPSRPWTATTVAVAAAFLVAVKVQACVVYFQAGVAKLSHQEWADGTAFYYWTTDPAFGLPSWLATPVGWLLGSAPVLVLFAWVPIALEVALAASVAMKPALRRYLLPVAIAFHLMIAVTMGLWSFAFTMWALDLLLLYPLGWSLRSMFRRPSAANSNGTCQASYS